MNGNELKKDPIFCISAFLGMERMERMEFRIKEREGGIRKGLV